MTVVGKFSFLFTEIRDEDPASVRQMIADVLDGHLVHRFMDDGYFIRYHYEAEFDDLINELAEVAKSRHAGGPGDPVDDDDDALRFVLTPPTSGETPYNGWLPTSDWEKINTMASR